jgi:sarcosine oxidase subunit beta
MPVERFDTVVLGAGVNGMSIAYELCKRKKRVAVIDKVVMGAGASGSCDDMILLQSKKPGILLEMAFRSLELFKGLERELPTDIEFENRGGTILIENQSQLSVMEEFAANQNRFGLEVEIIDAKRLRELQPLVSAHVIASTYSARDSQVNPMALMRAFFFGASALGLVFKKRTKPTAIAQVSNGWKISLDSGEVVEAETVVNATGAWAGEVSKLIGVDIPIAPRKGQVLVTEAIPPIGKTNVWSAQYIVSKLKPIPSGAAPNPGDKFGLGFAFTGTHSGNYLIGSTRENAGYDKTTDPEALALLARQVERFFPVMKDIHFIRSFAGLRPSTPDGMPFLGEVPGASGFFIAAGHEGDGIALSPITGVMTADLVEGKKPEFAVDSFKTDRFSSR